MHPTAEPGAPSLPPDRIREFGGNWGSLFQQSATPVFLLSRRRQIRFVNRAWESLAGKSLDVVRGLFCHLRKTKGTQPQRSLLQCLAPTPEVMAGRVVTVRRPAPPARLGPPWWEITFVPLIDDSGLTNILGFIHAVEQGAPQAPGTGQTEALATLRQKSAARITFDLLQSESPIMHRVQAQARLAAHSTVPVWIVGEKGVGKETLARIIHFQGTTRERTFVAIDCAGLQPYLVRAMLFGNLGQAGPQLGTICLKEPAHLAPELKSELLDWLEEQDAPPRIVCLCQAPDSSTLSAMDEFQSALNVLEIRLPPLRERVVDIAALTQSILRREADGRSVDLTAESLDRLRRHVWPENLRELTMVLRASLAASNGKKIEIAHLPLELRTPIASPPERSPTSLDEVLEQVERRMIALALHKSKGNRSEAADHLGIHRARLIRRIEALKLDS